MNCILAQALRRSNLAVSGVEDGLRKEASPQVKGHICVVDCVHNESMSIHQGRGFPPVTGFFIQKTFAPGDYSGANV